MGLRRLHSYFRPLLRVLAVCRLLCMLALTVAAVQLVVWNRNFDPRFHLFLSTRPGRTLSRVMQWPNLYNRAAEDKAPEDYTAEERRWRERIEVRVQTTWPTHDLEFINGEILPVRLLEVSGDQVRVEEQFGGQGRLERTLPRDKLRDIRPHPLPPPRTTWRDVRFQMEYPEFHLSYHGGYVVLADAPYHQVARTVAALEDLYAEYLEIFGALTRYSGSERKLQVLFFSNESRFRAHQAKHAPELANSVGYYSPLEDRMVVFNQQHAARTLEVKAEVEEEIRRLLSTAAHPERRQQILQMQAEAEVRIRERAGEETLATLRHEGAHHLSYSSGVHSWIHTENAWLVEGLAAYFESKPAGGPVMSYAIALQQLVRENRLPALGQLMAIRQPEHFERDLPGVNAHEAYALSWSLFRFCMQSERREGFFNYLRALREPESFRRLREVPRIELLAEALGMEASELTSVWRAQAIEAPFP